MADSSRLHTLRPALRQGWMTRLHQAPVLPAGAGLVTPAMLILMVDATLDQLFASRDRLVPLAATPRSARLATPRAGCQCGAYLLVTYYLAGVRALREVLPADVEPDRRRLVQNLIRVARVELAALCTDCSHRGGAFCQRPPHRPTGPPGPIQP